jgi:hypothetical protein
MDLDLCAPNSLGKPLEPATTGRTGSDCVLCKCKAAGVRDARLHGARHTAAALLFSGQGVDISVVHEILGHFTLTLHVRDEPAREGGRGAHESSVLGCAGQRRAHHRRIMTVREE